MTISFPTIRSSMLVGFRLLSAFVAVAGLAGCKSDLNQQLLERELRYQEDQIYNLQDELQVACAKLERAAGENASLKKQLGVGADAVPSRPGLGRPRPSGLPAPVNVPPAIEIPDGGGAPRPPASRGGPPAGPLAPPALEGVPPLPANGGASAVPTPAEPALSLPDTAAAVPPPIQRLAYEAPADAAPVARLVVNADQTACLDTDGDGRSEGLSIVFEPRDAEERLTAATGNVTITVFDAAAGADPATGEGTPIANWDIPAADIPRHFRRTSRMRGLHFSLPWPGSPPAGSHARVVVRLAPADGGSPLAADATIATR
ncbi:MAG: hypothetical protein WCC69_01415 [Pirellulales bacterium]